jgi:hypothetical protein
MLLPLAHCFPSMLLPPPPPGILLPPLGSGHTAPSQNAAPPSILLVLPLGNVVLLLPCQQPPSPDMMLPLGMMLSPKHAAFLCMLLFHGHAAQAKNRILIAPPMGHYFVTKGFFLWEVIIHLALNFVTLFQKYF